jgi:hypothetical protein
MSLTSYRAAPPRGGCVCGGPAPSPGGRWGVLAWLGVDRDPPRGAGRGVGEPGGDLLFRRLSGSTIGAEGFHGRVRDGIGCFAPRCGHQAGQPPVWPVAEPVWPVAEPRRGRGPSGWPTCRTHARAGRRLGECGICEGDRAKRSGAKRSGEKRPGGGGATGRRSLDRRWRWPLHAGGVGLATANRWIGRVRAISTGQLHGLLRFHPRPIDVVVFHGSRRDLVLRRASRLDAFSGYPVRT